MKDKEKKKVAVKTPQKEIDSELAKAGQPFVFEEDKKLLEELMGKSRYIRGIFSS